MGALTPKQQQFVDEYLVDLNATQAAIRAGYSAKTAGQQGERLLKNVEIAPFVQAAMDKRSQRTEITADYVIRGIRDLTDRCARQGAEHNPTAALRGYELLGKHLKLFTEKHEHSGPNGAPITVIELVAPPAGDGKITVHLDAPE